MTCSTCRKLFLATDRSRIVQDPFVDRKVLLIPLPTAEDWSLPDAMAQIALGMAKLLRVARQSMVEVGALAGASKDLRGLQMFATVANLFNGVLEYTEPKDFTEIQRVVDKHLAAMKEKEKV